MSVNIDFDVFGGEGVDEYGDTGYTYIPKDQLLTDEEYEQGVRFVRIDGEFVKVSYTEFRDMRSKGLV